MNRLPFEPYDFFGYLASGILIVVGMQYVLGFPQVTGQDFKIIDAAMLVLGVYVAGQLIATPAKALLEDWIVEKVLGRPHTMLFLEKKPFVRGMLFPGFYKPLPPNMRKSVLKKVETAGGHKSGEDLFLYVRYSPQVRNDEKIMARLGGFLNQYGFNRNLSFSSLVVGSAFLIKWGHGGDPKMLKFGLTLFAAGILLFYRYLKFFRQYSYELFNSYSRD